MSDVLKLSCGSTFTWGFGSEGNERWIQFGLTGDAPSVTKRIVWKDGEMTAYDLLFMLGSAFLRAWREWKAGVRGAEADG